MNHKTGWYCWIGGEKSWHRTHEAARRKCAVAQSQGLEAQVDCAMCGQRDDRCRCKQDD